MNNNNLVSKSYFFNLNRISECRKFLMGLSTLWIVLYHSKIPFTSADTGGISHFLYILDFYIYQFKSLGQVGVDIFLFLSAIGLYFSMEKEQEVSSFYKRRIKRILPLYLLINIIWEYFTQSNFIIGLKNILGITFVCDGYRGNWFFILLFFLYLFYPLIYRMIKNDNQVIFLIPAFILFNFFLSICFPDIFSNIEIALRRIPVFLSGCALSKYIKNGTKTKSLPIVIFSIFSYIVSNKFMINDEKQLNVLFRYAGSINAIAIVFIVSLLYSLIKQFNAFNRIINYFGTISLECYLLFEKIIIVLEKYIINRYTIALIGFVICVIMSSIIHQIYKRLIN